MEQLLPGPPKEQTTPLHEPLRVLNVYSIPPQSPLFQVTPQFNHLPSLCCIYGPPWSHEELRNPPPLLDSAEPPDFGAAGEEHVSQMPYHTLQQDENRADVLTENVRRKAESHADKVDHAYHREHQQIGVNAAASRISSMGNNLVLRMEGASVHHEAHQVCVEISKTTRDSNEKKKTDNKIVTLQNQNFPDYDEDVCGPDALLLLLKACTEQKDLQRGRRIHAAISNRGLLEEHAFLGSTLVNMYAKCGALAKAQEVFDSAPHRNLVLWNTLIIAYAQHKHVREALERFDQMQQEGLSPDAFTFSCILKSCGIQKAIDKGISIHAQIVRQGLMEKNVFVGSTLVNMYGKCGAVEKARKVLDELPVRNVVSWNGLIAGYTQLGHHEEALNCFDLMKGEGVLPDAITFACILKACGSLGALDRGQTLHVQIATRFLDKNIVTANALVDMYAKCGMLTKAQEVFDKLRGRDIITWNALMGGYAQHGHGEEALNCFKRMQCEGVSPDGIAFVLCLKSCGILEALEKGEELHAQIGKVGPLWKNVTVSNALIDMYVKCNQLVKAQEVFNELLVRDVVSWNTLIAGYTQNLHSEKALVFFNQMQREGHCPSTTTFVCILKACGSLGAIEKGQEIHKEIAREKFPWEDPVLANALIDLYAKCSLLTDAQDVFDELVVRDIVSWTTIIAGHAQHSNDEEALNLFEEMQLEGISPDDFTFVCVLKCCSRLGCVYNGQKIHAEIIIDGFVDKVKVVGIALVCMYANCGMLEEAQDVFFMLPAQDVISWNVLIGGHGQLGKDEVVGDFFNKMIGEGIRPDLVTYTTVLNACSHGGLLNEGQVYFEDMSNGGYGITPALEQYSCMVDLFCRVGHLYEAAVVIEKMPFSANITVWHTVMSASRKWGDIELGRWAFECVGRLDENNAAAYICISDSYVFNGKQDTSFEFKAREQTGIESLGHCWWADLNEVVHLVSI